MDFDVAVGEATAIDPTELVRLPAAEVYKTLNIPDAQAAQASQHYRERRALIGLLEDELYPEVDELLGALTGAGWRLGLASKQLEPLAKRILDRLGISDRFEIVVGSDVERTRTNKVEVLSHLQAQLTMPADGIAVIGDRASDIEASKSLEMTAIGAAWGFGSIDELIGANADAIAVTPKEVSDLLINP